MVIRTRGGYFQSCCWRYDRVYIGKTYIAVQYAVPDIMRWIGTEQCRPREVQVFSAWHSTCPGCRFAGYTKAWHASMNGLRYQATNEINALLASQSKLLLFTIHSHGRRFATATVALIALSRSVQNVRAYFKLQLVRNSNYWIYIVACWWLARFQDGEQRKGTTPP